MLLKLEEQNFFEQKVDEDVNVPSRWLGVNKTNAKTKKTKLAKVVEVIESDDKSDDEDIIAVGNSVIYFY